MNDFSENEKNKRLWEKLEEPDLEFRALEELAQLLNQAKVDEEFQAKGGSRTNLEDRTGQIESLFQHVIGRLQDESQKDAAELSKRLVALESLEKGLAGFLVARIEAMEHRIHKLQLERVRLEKIIDKSSKSIFGLLFTGVKSQFQLKSVKAELRILQEEKQRIWQKKNVLNSVRASVLGKSKECAQTVLQQAREEGLDHLQDWLMSRIEQCVASAEATGDLSGLILDGASKDPVCFGRFIKGLNTKEKAFIDRASDASNYAHGITELSDELSELLTEVQQESPGAVANRCLFLAKLLVGRRSESLFSGETLAFFRLAEKEQLLLPFVREELDRLSPQVRQRVAQIILLVRRIEALNAGTSTHSQLHVRKDLSRIFRDLLIRYQDVVYRLPDIERPLITERRRHSERVNHLLDKLMRFLVDHCDTLF